MIDDDDVDTAIRAPPFVRGVGGDRFSVGVADRVQLILGYEVNLVKESTDFARALGAASRDRARAAAASRAPPASSPSNAARSLSFRTGFLNSKFDGALDILG